MDGAGNWVLPLRAPGSVAYCSLHSAALCRKTFPGRVRGTADPSTAGRDRSASLGGCDFFNFPCSLWPESSEEHLPTSIAGVLRLRAINPLLCDRSARRFAPTARRGRQDDAFLEGIKQHLVGCKKHEKIEKVTGSQDDKGESGASMESGCRSEGVFHHLGWAAGPSVLCRKTFPGKVRGTAEPSTTLPRHAGTGRFGPTARLDRSATLQRQARTGGMTKGESDASMESMRRLWYGEAVDFVQTAFLRGAR